MLKVLATAGAAAAAFSANTALAAPPVLTSVSVQNRHATATLSAPRADSVTIYLASKPDRATDGQFLTENIEEVDSLTDEEIQTGRWMHESQSTPAPTG